VLSSLMGCLCTLYTVTFWKCNLGRVQLYLSPAEALYDAHVLVIDNGQEIPQAMT
jgi:hypothetical protein